MNFTPFPGFTTGSLPTGTVHQFATAKFAQNLPTGGQVVGVLSGGEGGVHYLRPVDPNGFAVAQGGNNQQQQIITADHRTWKEWHSAAANRSNPGGQSERVPKTGTAVINRKYHWHRYRSDNYPRVQQLCSPLRTVNRVPMGCRYKCNLKTPWPRRKRPTKRLKVRPPLSPRRPSKLFNKRYSFRGRRKG